MVLIHEQINQWNVTEYPEIDPTLWKSSVFNKGSVTSHGGQRLTFWSMILG